MPKETISVSPIKATPEEIERRHFLIVALKIAMEDG